MTTNRSLHAEHFYPWQNLAKPNGFGDMRKTTVWPLCSICSNGGHVFWWIKNPHSISMQDTQRNIHTKFGSNLSSSVRGEAFWKIINDDDGHQVKAIAHMTVVSCPLLFKWFKSQQSKSILVFLFWYGIMW